jgi:hypothetical protein
MASTTASTTASEPGQNPDRSERMGVNKFPQVIQIGGAFLLVFFALSWVHAPIWKPKGRQGHSDGPDL